MSTANTIVLRPRFKIELERDNETVLKAFEIAKTSQKKFIVNLIDNHVFIKFPKQEQHFWSPQLHLEIDNETHNSCVLHGLYGPSPTVWTLFMFLHFMVAGLFIASCIWAYTNWRLNSSYSLQVSLMIFMVIVWFVLYFAGSIGKISSKSDMLELQKFMNGILEN